MEQTSGATIVTLTMNPALDITTDAEVVRPTEKTRCTSVRYDPGGGGVNVAQVAHNLGASVAATFPAGGATGEAYADLLTDRGVPFRRVKIDGSTRESFTVNEISTGMQYRFVLPGPCLTHADQSQMVDELRRAAASAKFVVASGSLPPGVPVDFNQGIADTCGDLGVRLVLDTSGAGLQHITSGVFLIKASVRELRECVGRELATEAEQVAAANELIESGRAEAVVVSLGSKGALLVTHSVRQRFEAIPMRAVSGVGAGDAMVAAITVGLTRGWSLSTSVRFGIAAGAAMMLTPGTVPCTRSETERLFEVAAEPVDVGIVRPGGVEDALVYCGGEGLR